MDTRPVAVVKPAATVVLIRDAAHGSEVFLVRRRTGLAFMGGAHVFPGGQVDNQDRAAAQAHISSGLPVSNSRMDDVDASAALAFHFAAVRETAEESGLHVSLDSLVYFAWWVTPEQEDRRFDTRFFLTAALAGHPSATGDGETTDGAWVRPADALERCRRGEITLPPPTWTTLRWLEPFGDASEALEWARAKPIHRIQPTIAEHGEQRIVTLPDTATIPGVPVETRFLLQAGRWRPLVTSDGI